MPSWLIIVLVLAVVVWLLRGLLIGAALALFAAVCFVIAGVAGALDWLLVKSGYYRRRSRRRLRKRYVRK